MAIRSRLAVLGLLSFLLVSYAFGQAITGDLLVSVSDPNGATIPHAKVVLVQTGTQTTLTGSTDETGTYLFTQLRPATYKLTVSAPGFETTQADDVQIQIGQRARVGLQLSIGSVNESVTVSAGAETLLNAESASVGQVVQQAPIEQLPLNGRNFVQLAQLATGATPVGTVSRPQLRGPDAPTRRFPLRAYGRAIQAFF